MNLHDIDDLPFHQTPTPFNVLATSDVHFSDGYYFATYAKDWYISAGLRLHPNNNVIDGFATIAHHDEQRSCRFSRALRPDYTVLKIGPLSLEITSPMKSVRMILKESPINLSFDLTFNAVAQPHMELPYRHWKYGRLINDLVRYTQISRANGYVEFDGHRTNLDAWYAIRDHSWGIRASMGPRTPSKGAPGESDESDHRRFRIWVPFEVEGHSGFFQTHEGVDGSILDFEGVLDFEDGRRIKLVGVEHQIKYQEGTRNVISGSFRLRDELGGSHDYTMTSAGTSADVQGGGYSGGWHDNERPGTYRGIGPVVEWDRYATGKYVANSGPPHIPEKKRFGQTEFPCFLEGPNGAKGMAHFEHYIFGTYTPYGFA